MDDDQIKIAVDLLMSEIKKIKPGFSIINDISSFKPATQKVAEEIQRAQLFAKQSGVGKIDPPSDRGVRTCFSDDLLWLPYVIVLYIEATRDTVFLDEKIPFRVASPLA